MNDSPVDALGDRGVRGEPVKERIVVEVKHNGFTGLWEVHGRKVSYWLFEGQANRRRDEIQAKLDAELI